MQPLPGTDARTKIPWMGILFCLVLCGMLLCYIFEELLVNFIFEERGALWSNFPVALTVYTVCFCIAMSLILPFTPFCVVCGFFLPMSTGLLVQLFCITMSSLLIFAITSRLGKAHIKRVFDVYGFERYIKALERIQEDKWQNAKINFLLCLVPMPYGVHVYVFAIFDCPFLLFLIPFQTGMLPHVLCNLFVGNSISDSVEAGAQGIQDAQNKYVLAQSILYVFLCIVSLVVIQRVVSDSLSWEENEEVSI